MTKAFRPVNTQLRPVPGGFIARTWIGDRWAWRCFDNQRQLMGRTARTAAAAMALLIRHKGDEP